MRFSLLGPFEIVTDDGFSHEPGPPKAAQTLALFATQPGSVVGSDTLIRELWQRDPPRSALATAQTYVHHVRRQLRALPADGLERPVLTTQASGYVLRIDERAIDVSGMESLVRQADAELRQGRVERAGGLLKQALTMRRGPLVSNLKVGPVLAGLRMRLEELYLQAQEMNVEVMIRSGRHRAAVVELRALVHQHPLHESFHGRLITALFHCGRRTEALTAYRTLKRTLMDELGLDPLPSIQRLIRAAAEDMD
ncbi:AfsR/SARP family transcriptional regulator [Streptomyces montanus]|uniref:AfsR/SARP family transcriptional regulator n=1 Tax=Streptomyces montanus TaxID=2580423 RepID=A0A5R9FTJ8_9ACTN|nr:AfsR/SARP family transcriptional regulator [Streptomyces montanus]TLS47362.1 AfsR/SARP family transcriptional regulator [Streptomyces montanus]